MISLVQPSLSQLGNPSPVLKGLTGRLRCPNRDGRTALNLAARNGDVHVVELLIAAGANLAARDHSGYGRAPNGRSCAPLDREASVRQVDCAAYRGRA